jgi:regulator of sigma E protease
VPEILANPASPLIFILVISLVITIHELGHYWVGRIFGAAAESFSVGFGKSIVEVRDKRGTRWRINWLPLGGFVKFVGEMQAPQDKTVAPDQTTPGLVGKPFTALGPWQRLAVALGGPFANFIFAIAVFAGFGLAYGVPQAQAVQVAAVSDDSPAQAAGFRPGDVILAVGGRTVAGPGDVTRATQLNSNEPVSYLVRRATGEETTLTATPELREVRNEALNLTEKVGVIGINLQAVNVSVKRLNPIEAVGHGVSVTGDTIGATVNVIRRLVTGKEGIEKLSGPVGILRITDKMTGAQMDQPEVSLGQRVTAVVLMLLQLAAALSIGVGFFNLLPIPVLDGGTAVMCVAEGVSGRALPETVQRVGLTIGLVCLVGFALLITWKDVTTWVSGTI